MLSIRKGFDSLWCTEEVLVVVASIREITVLYLIARKVSLGISGVLISKS